MVAVEPDMPHLIRRKYSINL